MIEYIVFMTSVLGSLTFWFIWGLLSFIMTVIMLRTCGKKSEILMAIVDRKSSAVVQDSCHQSGGYRPYHQTETGPVDTDICNFELGLCMIGFMVYMVIWPLPASWRVFNLVVGIFCTLFGKTLLFCMTKGINAVPDIKVKLNK